MKKYIKIFLHRGLMCAGFGPIVVAVIFAVIENTQNNFSISGSQICLAIVSSYLLAFIHAGASIFNQIDELSHIKCTTLHFGTLYLAYVICYVVNTWIPFDPKVILVFSIIFATVYFIVWLTVVISIKIVSTKMNKKLNCVNKKDKFYKRI